MKVKEGHRSPITLDVSQKFCACMYRRYIIKKSNGDNALQILHQQFYFTIRSEKGQVQNIMNRVDKVSDSLVP
jgi:hypothetical protein